tara:strand:+ start:223 stop:354 length:132 start_codon:yes stop_codon:yes gene_type:complete
MGREKSLQSIDGQGTKICPECDCKELDRNDDELYCTKCGLVID